MQAVYLSGNNTGCGSRDDHAVRGCWLTRIPSCFFTAGEARALAGLVGGKRGLAALAADAEEELLSAEEPLTAQPSRAERVKLRRVLRAFWHGWYISDDDEVDEEGLR